eukprot:CAMPEP_0174710360 /NCGR_PEP_ID=MMETSP1094-20130205/12020_1 /TAXON_ID=156173 /ORGANISM="Chrysochromulina brevifilum, Strain UTEX LB 985" /LENGTH=112 /DNA_ID=CAMNT_0015909157 /DNA_START=274 /DNA_END=612 /DNA_ORIENTATION=+
MPDAHEAIVANAHHRPRLLVARGGGETLPAALLALRATTSITFHPATLRAAALRPQLHRHRLARERGLIEQSLRLQRIDSRREDTMHLAVGMLCVVEAHGCSMRRVDRVGVV